MTVKFQRHRKIFDKQAKNGVFKHSSEVLTLLILLPRIYYSWYIIGVSQPKWRPQNISKGESISWRWGGIHKGD